MEEQLVSFDTARLAKQCGFKEKCHNYYQVDKEAWLNHSVNSPVDYNGVEDSRKLFSAPTQSLLQKWLREKHEINIDISCFTNTKTNKGSYDWTIYSSLIKEESEDPTDYLTYEDALEDALKESLKLIISSNADN